MTVTYLQCSIIADLHFCSVELCYVCSGALCPSDAMFNWTGWRKRVSIVECYYVRPQK